MGVVISHFKSQNNDNYEKILSELDDNIRKSMICLGEIKQRERNALINWVVYSLLAYVAYVIGYWYFIYMSNEEENWDFMKVAPVITGPFFIVIGYRFLTLWYKTNETDEISRLEHLRAKQKLKVEELKKKTGYYTTKTLLDRSSSSINWYDKLFDVIAGEDEQKYALICKHCHTWNGLTSAAEFDNIQYHCKNCNYFNPPRKPLTSGIVSSPKPKPLSKSLSPSSLNRSRNNNNNLLSSSNGKLDTSIVDFSLPKRSRSTTPRIISRDLSSDP